MQAQEKKQPKEDIMATIICECLENESSQTLSKKFEKKLNECYRASVLGALLYNVPTDKDSSITINSDGTSDQITDKDKANTIKILENKCDVYNKHVKKENSYNEYLEKSSAIACDCIGNIPTSLSTEQKNELISECIANGFVDSNASENLKLNTVEDIRAFSLDMKRKLVDDCAKLKRVAFSNDEEKLFSYSSNQKATDFYNKGITESEKGNYKKALKFYKKAVSIDANFVYAWDNLGRTYRELNDYDNAIKAYKKSIAIDSLNPTPLMNIAVVYSRKKDFETSAYWYNKLVEANPKNPEGHYGLALAYMYSKKLEASLNSIITAHNLYRTSKSPYVADAEKVMQYLYAMFEEQNKIEDFKRICKERNINLEID